MNNLLSVLFFAFVFVIALMVAGKFIQIELRYRQRHRAHRFHWTHSHTYRTQQVDEDKTL